jgi:argininosuccinate lyase
MKVLKGLFRKPLDPVALKFSSSLGVDRRLYREDIEGSIAHAAMLEKQKIISREDANSIRRALREIGVEIDRGTLSLDPGAYRSKRFAAEDVHMAIEHRLIEKIGERGGRLHTARSRNDQIVLDERLFLRKTVRTIVKELRRLQRGFVVKADQFAAVVMPGYTHLQRAQPVLLAHHLLAYVSMLERDVDRFMDSLKRINRSPLGAGALAGTSFPIDRTASAKALKFDGLVVNSIDAVSDRDVQIEFLAACAVSMMHLSRFAEELVLWSSREWRFAEIGDAFTTGSSIMPQKKNPDMAELIRGKTGRVYGDLMALLTVMKGLPLAYNRDMQEDKEPLFDAADTLTQSLRVCTAMLGTVKFSAARFERELQADFLLATELADYLARKGLPFRKAHAIVGSIVRFCAMKRTFLAALSTKELKKFSTLFNDDVHRLIDVRASLSQKLSLGSTSPKQVRAEIRRWKKILKSA